MKMNIGICGLGLIGGSLAKAIKKNTNNKVFGYDASEKIYLEAKMFKAVDDKLTTEKIKICDIVFVAVYPQATIEYIKENQKHFKKDALVVDCSGIKRNVCEECFPIAKENSFTFIGGHPMAGTQYSGFKYARDNLYNNATMLLVPPNDIIIEKLEALQGLLKQIGFAKIQITNAQMHDKVIAFTSQLPHVISNSYIKSPQAEIHRGYSAGSYRDLSRVAQLNAEMWTDLFLHNADNLIFEIDTLIENLQQYSDALKKNDAVKLITLLNEGNNRKHNIDKGNIKK